MRKHSLSDASDLVDRFPFAVDNLGHAVAQMPMMVDVCVDYVLKREVFQPDKRCFHVSFPVADMLKKLRKV
jgi:hypothetical protein